MKEAEVQGAFVAYLFERSWDARTDNADFADVIATRGAETLVAQVKGHTSSPGLDVDTMYGQILRRMTAERIGSRFALVVPETLLRAVSRVPSPVRACLGLAVFLVDDFGGVRSYSD